MKEDILEETGAAIERVDGWKEERRLQENRRQKLARKRREAARRQKLRNARGDAGQIKRLIALGLTAKRERDRLVARIVQNRTKDEMLEAKQTNGERNDES